MNVLPDRSPSARPAPRLVRAVGVVGALGLAVYIGLSASDAGTRFSGMLLEGGLMVVALAISGLRACHGDERRIWLTLTIGLALWCGGATYYMAVEPAGFSAADVGWLGAYPFFWGAFAQLVRARVRGLKREMWIDGLTCALTIAAVSITIVHYTSPSDAAERMTSAGELVYPVINASLVAIAVAGAGAYGWVRDRTFLLLGAGFALLSLADLVWLIEVTNGDYALGSAIDPAWPAALLLMAVAGWQPARPVRALPAGRRLALPVFFAAVSIVLLAGDHLIDNPVMANPGAVVLSCGALLCVLIRLVVTFRQRQRKLSEIREQATTDALTGLGNRRRLHLDLEAVAARGDRMRLVIFDLNGFKAYNDTFGHLAGDELLRRLGGRLVEALEATATAYRLGGDEFCLLADARHGERPIRLALDALADADAGAGDDWRISAAWGAAVLGEETADPVGAMGLADRRMYEGKRSGRIPAEHQVRDAVLAVLEERGVDLGDDHGAASDVARAVVERIEADSRRLGPRVAPRH